MLLLSEERKYSSALPAKESRLGKETLRGAWSEESQRGSEAPCRKASPSGVAFDVKSEKLCACREPLWWQRTKDDGETAVELKASRQTSVSQTDTAATPMRVVELCFRESGGKIEPRCGTACAADDHEIRKAGWGALDFQIWKILFTGGVPVVNTLRDKKLFGWRF